MAKKEINMGKWAFLIGIFGSLIMGLLGGLEVFLMGTTITVILVVLGLVAGLVQIPKKQVVLFIVVGIAIGAGSAGLAALPFVGAIISSMLSALAIFMVPAVVAVGVKTLVTM